MKYKRVHHSLDLVNFDDFSKYCAPTTAAPTTTTTISSTTTPTLLTITDFDGECYVDNCRDRQPLSLYAGSNDAMTVEMCQKLCFKEREEDYFYAGVQNYKECWCGNAAPTQKAPETDCNRRCSGDQSQFCGGACRNNVYSRKGQ